MGAGDRHIRRISHDFDGAHWSFTTEDDWDVSAHIPNAKPCLTPVTDPTCDYIASVGPDWTGNIWFSTAKGVVGVLDPDTGVAQSLTLGGGETVGNGMATSPAGVAIVSTHALYMFEADASGAPRMMWREPYDRGSGVKPGQLTWGSGTTPTFFGAGGDKYLAITDNADVQMNLLVYKVHQTQPKLLCTTPLFSPGASATDASPIGIGQSIIISNSYGYAYRNPSPLADHNAGGLQRVDVDGNDCNVVWTNPLKQSAMPKMSLADDKLYTISRNITTLDGLPSFRYDWTVIDARTGTTEAQTFIGNSFNNDAFFLAGNINPFTGDYYQGVVGGILQFHAP